MRWQTYALPAFFVCLVAIALWLWVRRAEIRQTGRQLKRRLNFCRALLADGDTPRVARWLVGAALFYLAMPFDLIPDWIPVIGHLDDAVVVPLLLWAGLKLVPASVRKTHQHLLLE